MSEKNWYAIYTRSRSEKKVAELLVEKGINSYLPLVKTMRQWSDRKKKVEVPLIRSYVFVNISRKEYDEVLQTQGVVAYVTFEGKAAKIPDQQIEAVRIALEGRLEISAYKDDFKRGEKVKIVSGPMKGFEGEYVGIAKKRNFIIRLSSIGYSLKVELDAAEVEKI